MASTPERIVIACGGTGGHLFPGIAVAQAAQRRGHRCLLLISEKEIDSLASKAHGDMEFAKIPAIAMPKPLSLAMVKFLWKFWQTIRSTRKLLQDFQATAVLGMGGFTSLPPLYAGQKLGLKTFLHESNAIPGKANKMASKFCKLVLLGLDACAQFFPAGKTRVVGTPLRESLLAQAPSVETAAAGFGLDPTQATLLVMGGSQGARGVNEAVVKALALLGEDVPQVLHLTGPKEIDRMRSAYSELEHVRAHVAPFCSHMEHAYVIADACVCRSGASSLTELSAFGIPTLLIPYPHAADDHQTRNAEVFVAAGAAVMEAESNLTPEKMATHLKDLLQNSQLRENLHNAMRALKPEQAAERVVDAIEA
jgi:UDP-N-acetylglucosamine--N-acetylmuramyl-(pentapeptide) pyrophosphoryl-undecaprenol N-acetylglucosamine transferase